MQNMITSLKLVSLKSSSQLKLPQYKECFWNNNFHKIRRKQIFVTGVIYGRGNEHFPANIEAIHTRTCGVGDLIWWQMEDLQCSTVYVINDPKMAELGQLQEPAADWYSRIYIIPQLNSGTVVKALSTWSFCYIAMDGNFMMTRTLVLHPSPWGWALFYWNLKTRLQLHCISQYPKISSIHLYLVSCWILIISTSLFSTCRLYRDRQKPANGMQCPTFTTDSQDLLHTLPHRHDNTRQDLGEPVVSTGGNKSIAPW